MSDDAGMNTRIGSNGSVGGDQEARRLPIGTEVRNANRKIWTKVAPNEWAHEDGSRKHDEDVMTMRIVKRMPTDG